MKKEKITDWSINICIVPQRWRIQWGKVSEFAPQLHCRQWALGPVALVCWIIEVK